MTGAAHSESQTPGCLVLYVEDDDASAFLFQRAMRETDTRMNMFRVGDGEQAIAFLQRGGIFPNAAIPELVILDVNLPKRSGFDVLAVIRDTAELKSVPVVMFSSSTLPAHRSGPLPWEQLRFFQRLAIGTVLLRPQSVSPRWFLSGPRAEVRRAQGTFQHSKNEREPAPPG
jgi:CheY-like chemotaxis protein